MESRLEELNRFKRLDLIQFAISRGFQIDKRASSLKSVVVRHPCGDKLIISKASDGTHFYFNAKGNDNGTIIDLVQMLDGGSIGDVRKILRRYDPRSVAMPQWTCSVSMDKTTFDREAIRSKWDASRPIEHANDFLSNCRCIPSEVYLEPIFAGRFRTDRRGNVIAAHFDDNGLCGFEMKNGTSARTTFTGFSPGGVKGLCASRPRSDDQVMVIAETFIDMLSVAALLGTKQTRFFSTAGRPSPKQLDLIAKAAKRMPQGSRLQLRFDNDDGGEEISKMIESELTNVDIVVTRVFPAMKGFDWNDVVRNQTPAVPTRELTLGK